MVKTQTQRTELQHPEFYCRPSLFYKRIFVLFILIGISMFGCKKKSNSPTGPEDNIGNSVTEPSPLPYFWEFNWVGLSGTYHLTDKPKTIDTEYSLSGRGEFIKFLADGSYITSLTDGFDEGYIEALLEMELGTSDRMWYKGTPSEPDTGSWYFNGDQLALVNTSREDTLLAKAFRNENTLTLIFSPESHQWSAAGDLEIRYQAKMEK